MDRAERDAVAEQVLLAVEIVVVAGRVVDEQEREVPVEPLVARRPTDLLAGVVGVASGPAGDRLVVGEDVGEARDGSESVALSGVGEVPA